MKSKSSTFNGSSNYHYNSARIPVNALLAIALLTGAMVGALPDPDMIGLHSSVPIPSSLSSPSVTLSEVSGLARQSVLLPCQLSQDTCGSIHSIKWYKGDRRVYIFSEIGAISRAEDDLADRATLRFEPNSSMSHLEIKPLLTSDENLYKCEVTYLEAKEHCALLQSIQLNTFAKPEYVRIEDMRGSETANTSMIGPHNEGTVITLICISGGGKPVASLQWYNNSKAMEGQYRNMTEEDGTGIGRNQLTVTLGRGDLGAKLECQASSPVLNTMMKAWVEVDVYVRPSHWEVTGYDGPVLEGTVLTLLCRAQGARPAANLTWYNGTQLLSPQLSSNLAVQEEGDVPEIQIYSEVNEADGTYETQSKLIFTATRYDNGITISCLSSNMVMESMGEIPYKSEVKLDIHYQPVVTVSPSNVTVNETSQILLLCEVDANPGELLSLRWYRNGDALDVSDLSMYAGGTIDETSLVIKNSSRQDLGVYSCVAQNPIGSTQSSSVAYVNVLYKPTVNLIMDPSSPVKEQEERNVTLTCNVNSGNPAILLSVRWYLRGDLLKELPECPGSNTRESALYIEGSDDLCDLDPSKLMLETVGRSFEGNYTCEGRNEAGWGLQSPPVPLHVHYPPGPARLGFDPLLVVKGQSLTMQCIVEELGRPSTAVYRWTRGTYVQNDVRSSKWTISPVSLETRSNFSCEAVNEAGFGQPASVIIDVFAPPAFIERLPPYMGVLTTAREVSVSCQVECYPLCNILWLKDGLPLGESQYYSIKTTTLPPDETTYDFESVRSTLTWNLTAWPNGLDRLRDNANYTCQSTDNSVGTGVSSTTYFRVEFPPESIHLSDPVINVAENEIPGKVTCSATAFPDASYTWMYGDEVVSDNSAVLFLDHGLPRAKGGDYTCVAHNKHGNISDHVIINILYAPECKITLKEKNDEMLLVCEVNANPEILDFVWMLDNVTYTEEVHNEGITSSIPLIASPDYFGKYKCFANNSIGRSIPCERIISATSWIRKLSDDKVIIIAAIVGASIVLFLIVCIIIILICRKRRMNEKYRNSRVEERQNPEGKQDLTSNGTAANGSLVLMTTGASTNNAQNATQLSNESETKWPIKPGVHLHVNGLHSLGKSNAKPIIGFSYGTKNSLSTLPTPGKLNGGNSVAKTGLSTSKLDVPPNFTNQVGTRKRKRSSKDPSPAHRKGDSNADDNPKGFYENLPFHGLQQPQPKTLLTPLSLQYQNSHLQMQDGQGSATLHRTFPSNQASDLLFTSLHRKSGRGHGPSMVDILDSTAARSLSGRPSLMYADIVQGHSNNPLVRSNGVMSSNHGRNGLVSHNNPNTRKNADNNAYYNNPGISIPLVTPGAPYPSIRNSEINV